MNQAATIGNSQVGAHVTRLRLLVRNALGIGYGLLRFGSTSQGRGFPRIHLGLERDLRDVDRTVVTTGEREIDHALGSQ